MIATLKNGVRHMLKGNVMGTVTHFKTTAPVAALTFDDGPSAEFTPPLLDLLKKYGARATFFMVGKAAEEHAALVRRIAEGGHAVANHSYEHKSLPRLKRTERFRQVRACRRAVHPYGVRLFRPPWGSQNVATRMDLFYMRHDVIAWSVDVEDWSERDSNRMADLLVEKVRPGSIILLHDALYNHGLPTRGPAPCVNREPMLRALDLFLQRMSQSMQFVTIPEMFRCGRAVRQVWYHPPKSI